MVTYKDTKLLCHERKHNICSGEGNSIFTKRNCIHRMSSEDGVGVRGHKEELGVTRMDAIAILFSMRNLNGPHLS